MFRSPEDAYATFQQVKLILNNKGVDFMAPCGKQNLHDCDLFKHIGVCNDVLAAIQVHMDELVETREVAVCFSATTSDREEPREDVQRAVVLLHRLLVKHICVATIVLDDLGRFCNQGLFSILCNGISKCRGLKSLRVNAVNDEASYYRQLLTGCLSLENLEEVCFKRIRDSNRGDYGHSGGYDRTKHQALDFQGGQVFKCYPIRAHVVAGSAAVPDTLPSLARCHLLW
ncbi:hypothetical protein MRX96_001223 [Rhipicephalus microplus]